jgi:hypothetical protein
MFEHLPSGNYRPRMLFVDSEADSCEQILQTCMGKSLPKEQFVFDGNKSDHTWA